jgi:hypothetical protein
MKIAKPHSPDSTSMNCAVNSSHTHIIVPSEFGYGLTSTISLCDLSPFPGVQHWLAAKHSSSGFRSFDSFVAPCPDQFPLELRHPPHDGQNQFAMGGSRVEPRIIQGFDMGCPCFDGVEQAQ